MNINNILRRAFDLTRHYRALWLFGAILALTTTRGGGGGGGNGGGGGGSALSTPSGYASKMTIPLFNQAPGEIVALIAGLAVLAGLIIGIFSIARVVATTSLILMVDAHERSGRKVGILEGFRLGWSRAAARIFLIDLLVGVIAALVILLLLAAAFSPLSLFLVDQEMIGGLGALISFGLLIPVILMIIILAITLVILQEFFHRASVLEGLSVFVSIRRGWQVARSRAGESLLLGVILFAIGLGAAFVLIPLMFISGLIGAGIAAVPGVVIGLVASLFTQGASAWIAGLVVAMPIFLFIVMVPMLFASGLVEVFSSSAWTLAYREVTGLDSSPVAISQ